MSFWVATFKVIGCIWLVLAGLIVMAGIIGVGMEKGFSGVQDLLSPFNVINYTVTIITLAPGIGFLMLSDKLQKKSEMKLRRHK